MPAVLVQLAQHDRFTIARRLNPHDVARIITDQVAARYPCRQAEHLAFRIRMFDAASYLIQMSAEAVGANVVDNGGLAD